MAAGGEEALVLNFFVSGAACPELLPKAIRTKEKHTVVEPLNLRVYLENFNSL